MKKLTASQLMCLSYLAAGMCVKKPVEGHRALLVDADGLEIVCRHDARVSFKGCTIRRLMSLNLIQELVPNAVGETLVIASRKGRRFMVELMSEVCVIRNAQSRI